MDRRLALLLIAAAAAAPGAVSARDEHRHPSPKLAPAGAQHWTRGDRTWWRGRAEWRDYKGERPGFSYAPGYGYYPVDRAVAAHAWRRGEYLPETYRHRVVADWAYFGVRSPPRGYAWVWCGRQIALVSQSSGLILDVEDNVF
ncbi:MAG TPA: RcnB family protein [Caulobacteraceae bacterium]|jgi:Ni/Co efflux regulator RcnB|nr:RcnB family protein [Caulobacteraceae bacterium]